MTVATFPALGYDPAPGSAEAIRALAADCRQLAGQLTSEAHTLTSIGHTGWTGPAALAFTGTLDSLPDDLRTAAHSFTHTAGAIDRYAAELADAQLAARRAETAAHTAQHAQRAARAALDTATHPATAEPARRRLAQADQDLTAARRHAQHATQQAQGAAHTAAAAVRQASQWAPRQPHHGLFDRLGDAIADGWNRVTGAIHDWVVDHAELLQQISQTLGTISAISGTLALAICWIPLVGQAAAGALGTIAAVTGGAATATNALLAANGQGDWTSVAVDLGLTALGGAGKLASKAVTARRAAGVTTVVRASSATESTQLFRRTSNVGDFASLVVPMQKRVVRDIARRAGIGLEGVKIKIIRDPHMIGSKLQGWTSPKGIVQLYPDAFLNKETLVRTLGHERIHVYQVRTFGPPADSEVSKLWERLAYATEDDWWRYANERK